MGRSPSNSHPGREDGSRDGDNNRQMHKSPEWDRHLQKRLPSYNVPSPSMSPGSHMIWWNNLAGYKHGAHSSPTTDSHC